MANLKVSIVVRTTNPDGKRGWVPATGNPAAGVWLGTVEEIASYIRKQREDTNPPTSKK